jgi:hypothetical protein
LTAFPSVTAEIDEKTKELLEREPDKAESEHQSHPGKHRAQGTGAEDQGCRHRQTAIHVEQTIDMERMVANQPFGQTSLTGHSREDNSGQAVSWAEQHLFERRSVVHEHEIWHHALEHLRGQDVSLAEIQGVTRKRDYIRDEQFQGKITTRDVLQRELNIVRLAQHQMNQYQPLAFNYRRINHSLDYEQGKRWNRFCPRVISSRCFAAGRGRARAIPCVKSKPDSPKLVRSSMSSHRSASRSPIWNATASPARKRSVLFSRKSSMRRGAVVLVDEAGQIGGEQMLQLLDYIQINQGRVILSGDTHQHGAVEASDALRAIEKYAGLGYAELTNIRRQNPDSAKTQAERRWLEQYKLAVDEAQRGKLGASFDRLDNHDAIVSCSLADQQQKLTEHFLELFKNQQSTVVVSQSWSEIHKVNEQVRLGLKAQKLIGDDETTVTALERQDLTDAQKRDKRFYQPDSVLVFNRPTAGFKSGSAGKLRGITDKHLLIEADNRIRPVPFKELDKITVCQPKELSLSSRRPAATQGQCSKSGWAQARQW